MIFGREQGCLAAKRLLSVGVAAVLIAGAIEFRHRIPLLHALQLRVFGKATIEKRVAEHGPAARARLGPAFVSAAVSYPTERFVIAVFKAERELHLCARDEGGVPRFVKSYPVLGASGTQGPKLREGDGQVPEGRYRIEALNPNSRFHLSLRIDYPNRFDRARAAEESRSNLGGNIFIHGGMASVGCLAIGDEAVEELFVLAADAGIDNSRVLLCPCNLRRAAQLPQSAPPWVAALYAELERELRGLPTP